MSHLWLFKPAYVQKKFFFDLSSENSKKNNQSYITKETPAWENVCIIVRRYCAPRLSTYWESKYEITRLWITFFSNFFLCGKKKSQSTGIIRKIISFQFILPFYQLEREKITQWPSVVYKYKRNGVFWHNVFILVQKMRLSRWGLKKKNWKNIYWNGQ